MVKVNNLEGVMEEYGFSLPTDLIFIKEQIAGPLDSASLGNEVQRLCRFSSPSPKQNNRCLAFLFPR